MMSPSATSQILRDRAGRVFNRVAYTDEVQGSAAAEYLFHRLGVRRLAIVHIEEPYGQGLAESVAQHFMELTGEVVAVEPLPPDLDNYLDLLSAIATKNPQAIYYAGYLEKAVVLAHQKAQSGLRDVVFFGSDGIYSTEFIERTGPDGEGVYAVGMPPPPSDAVFRFNEIYQNEYNIPAGSLSPFTWNSYDAAAVLIEAIKRVAFVGDDGSLYIPRDELIDVVRGTRDFPGLSGPITCSPIGECNASGPVFYVVRNGKWELAETD